MTSTPKSDPPHIFEERPVTLDLKVFSLPHFPAFLSRFESKAWGRAILLAVFSEKFCLLLILARNITDFISKVSPAKMQEQKPLEEALCCPPVK